MKAARVEAEDAVGLSWVSAMPRQERARRRRPRRKERGAPRSRARSGGRSFGQLGREHENTAVGGLAHEVNAFARAQFGVRALGLRAARRAAPSPTPSGRARRPVSVEALEQLRLVLLPVGEQIRSRPCSRSSSRSRPAGRAEFADRVERASRQQQPLGVAASALRPDALARVEHFGAVGRDDALPVSSTSRKCAMLSPLSSCSHLLSLTCVLDAVAIPAARQAAERDS